MGTRADNKAGSCREILAGRHAGKWRVQCTQVTDTGRPQRLSRIFPSKGEGKTFLQGLRKGQTAEAASRSEELTLARWFAWLAENVWLKTLTEVTIEQRKRRFANYVAAHMGHLPLSKIDPMTVHAFYAHLKRNGASDSLVISVKGDLVRAFNQAAVPYRRVPATLKNPFRLPLPRPRIREAVALMPEEGKKALSSKDLEPSRRAMVGVFLLGGLRLGEQMALTRGEIRFEAGLTVVDRAVWVEFGGKQSVGQPKGGKTRTAVMCPTLQRFLAEHAKDLDDGDLLWPSASENKPRMKKLTYATWRTIVRDAKLPAGMSPHDCRLSHVNWIEKLMPEVSPTTLKDHVGHASGATVPGYPARGPLSSPF